MRDAGQQDQELLAAEAVGELEGAQPLAQLVGDVAQHRVAAVVAVAVVDLLEGVHVAQQHADRLVGETRLVGDLGEAGDQGVAVEQAGERVEDRFVAMVELGGLQRPHDRHHPGEQRERGDRPARGRRSWRWDRPRAWRRGSAPP